MARCRHFLTAFVLCSRLTIAEVNEADWWDDRWESRLPIVVQAQPSLHTNRPVVIHWEEITRALGNAEVRPSSLRLVDKEKLIPFQIDHRDEKGRILPPGNLVLDPQDELVFVCRSEQELKLHLYFSALPKPLVAFPASVKVTSGRGFRRRAHQTLSTAGMEIAVQGDGLLDRSAHQAINYGRGSVVELIWQRVNLISHVNWNICMNQHPFSSWTGGDNRWQMVKLVVDGPVRKVVAAKITNFRKRDKDGRDLIQVDVTRTFSMYSGVPHFDIENVARFSQVPPDWTATYADRFLPGGRRDANDVLWDASTGKLQKFALAEKNLDANPRGELVSHDKVVDGWYAWIDQKVKTGLAVFYRTGKVGSDEPSADAVGFSAGWRMWSNINWMSFRYEGLKAPTTLRHRFRVIGLKDAVPEQVAAEHRIWASDDGNRVTIGNLERR